VGSNPTLSATTPILPSLSIVYRPTTTWQAVRAARPGWAASLLVQVLPFALLCAVAWPSFGTVVLTLVAVVILALAFFVLAPVFDVARSWDRSMALAAYASTPVLLSWFLLVFPPFMVVPVAALIHCFALCYLGVQQLLECRESEAAMFVAAAWVLSAIAGMLLGGLCSAAGLI
jgi:Yip1-like protein